MRYRTAILVVSLVLLALFGWHWLFVLWSALSPYLGKGFEYLPLWAFLFSLSFVLGFLLVALGQLTRPLLVGALAGAFLSIWLGLDTRFEFTAEATAATYFWVYGLFVVPLLGTLPGALLASRVRRRAAV